MEKIGDKIAQMSQRGLKKGSPNISSLLEGGKLPPQALDLEEAVLGALMLQKNH
jgi:hypothetical protein